jgi:hypothetical protein
VTNPILQTLRQLCAALWLPFPISMTAFAFALSVVAFVPIRPLWSAAFVPPNQSYAIERRYGCDGDARMIVCVIWESFGGSFV